MLAINVIDLLWNVFLLLFSFALISFTFSELECRSEGPCRYKEKFGATTAGGKLRNLTLVTTWKIALAYGIIFAVLLGPVLTGTFFSFGHLIATSIFFAAGAYFTMSWTTFHFFSPLIDDIIEEHNLDNN
jgi:hypothetical protein